MLGAEESPHCVLLIDGDMQHDRWTLSGDAPSGTARVIVTTTDGEAVDAELAAARWSARLSAMRHPRQRLLRKPYDAHVLALRRDGSVIASQWALLYPEARSLGHRMRSRLRRSPRGFVTYGPGHP